MVEWTRHGRDGLNARMNRYRELWMQRALGRDMRMVDMQIMASLQNGTAFFASTSLIALGGALALLRSTEEIMTMISGLPFGIQTTRELWEAKTVGLVIIFVYAFFKFGWSYRLFNYVVIMLGAMPFATEKDTPEAASPCAAHGATVRIGRPALQPRPARDLLRARLSRLVHGPGRLDPDHGGRAGRHVAAAVRVR